MEKRKTIGIFLEGDDVLQEGLIANALIGEAQVKDYNILMYHSLMKKPDRKSGRRMSRDVYRMMSPRARVRSISFRIIIFLTVWSFWERYCVRM